MLRRLLQFRKVAQAGRRMLPTLSNARFPILQSVADVREWRRSAFEAKQSVGFIPTMGALHEGHLELGAFIICYALRLSADHSAVRQSLKNTDRTICSIFVNPAQFAPSEDLTTYPRTLESDLDKLQALKEDGKRVEGLFLPAVKDLYPDGIVQDVTKQRGTFVEVVGYSQEVCLAACSHAQD